MQDVHTLYCPMQVFLAVLVRGFRITPLDINEAFTTWPVGGEPVARLLMDVERV